MKDKNKILISYLTTTTKIKKRKRKKTKEINKSNK